MRTQFIIPLALMSLVLFSSWGETLTMDDLVEGQKDTLIGITPTTKEKNTPLPNYSTVTDFAKLRGWSTSVPFSTAVK